MARTTVKPPDRSVDATAKSSRTEAAGPRFIEPMEAQLVEALPEDSGWQFEPKWHGFRCLAVRAGTDVELFAKSGKPLARYFPEVADLIARLPPKDFVLDGELTIPVGDTLSFEALQMRLHPAASRVRKLAAETPTVLLRWRPDKAPRQCTFDQLQREAQPSEIVARIQQG